MFLSPSLILPRTTAITLDHLQQLAVQGLVFDLDNTLMPPHTGEISTEVRQWLSGMREAQIPMICVSNNKRVDYCDAASQVIEMPVIAYARKPDPEKLLAAVAQLNLKPHQIAVIGDRPLTDIWGGQRIGAKTILVDPLLKGQERPLYVALRWLEWRFVQQAWGF